MKAHELVASLVVTGVLAAVTAGCPEKPAGSNGGGGDSSSVSSDIPMSGKLKKPTRPAGEATPGPETAAQGSAGANGGASSSPAADDPDFPRAALFDLYETEVVGTDAARHAALKKYGLEDDRGSSVPPRVVAYEAALRRFSTEHADEWSTFVDRVEQARAAKVAGGASVDKQ